jgi:hypothetical protein
MQWYHIDEMLSKQACQENHREFMISASSPIVMPKKSGWQRSFPCISFWTSIPSICCVSDIGCASAKHWPAEIMSHTSVFWEKIKLFSTFYAEKQFRSEPDNVHKGKPE